MTPPNAAEISVLEYHVLLAMAGGPLHGYGVKEAVEVESSGALAPRAGSLYRVIARLITRGYVTEAAAHGSEEPHPGRPRRYYELTREGRAALADEAARLRGAAALAEERLGAMKRRS